MNNITLEPYQTECSQQGVAFLRSQLGRPRPKGVIWVCPARTGKTYSIGWVLAELLKDIPEDSHRFCDVLWLTRKTLKIQSTRVLQLAGVSDRSLVESSQAMTSSFGEGLFLQWQTIISNNEIDYVPIWIEDSKPRILVIDECQDAKNSATLFYKIIEAAVLQGIMILMSSATPYTRLSETKAVLLALGIASSSNWKSTAQYFAENTTLDEFSPSAMRRLDDYLIGTGQKLMFKNIKYRHRCFNKVRKVDFDSPQHRAFYEEAYNRYLEEIAKQNRHEPEGVRRIWVAMQKFRHAAEMIRAGLLARIAHTTMKDLHKQVAIITNFVDTQDIIRDVLHQTYKIPFDKISIIRGGQNDRLRQREIDKFQRGYSDFVLAIGRSGGAGLDLSHVHKSARPRHLVLPPTWSAIELVQFLGRCHGPMSLSTTYQDTVWYKDTIEDKVADRVEIKLRSLKEIVDRRETWVDLFSKLSEEDAKGLEKAMIEEDLKELSDDDGNMFVDTLAVEALANE